MDLVCPHCDGTGTVPGRRERFFPCRGRGRIRLTRRHRQDLVIELIEREAPITTPAERLGFGVVAKAIHDLGTPNDSTAEVLDGALVPYLEVLGVGHVWVLELLADAHLVPHGHFSRPRPANPCPEGAP